MGRAPLTLLLTEHLTDAERKYRRQPREWVAEFVKAGLPEDFADLPVRHLKKGKPTFLAAELAMP